MAYILTLRMEKGSMLTYEELDDNFLFLKQKVEALESADTSADAVLFTPQELTPGQQQIVWSNIGSMAVDFSNLPGNLSAEAKSSFKQKLDIPESFEITDYVSFSPNQGLDPAEKNNARNNINATDRRLEELAGNLLEGDRAKIRQKISAASLEDVGNIIDDTQASDDTTYSSNVIDQKLNLKLDLDLSNLSDDLTESEKGIIQDKLGIEDTDLTGLLTNPTYDSDTHIFTMEIVGGGTFSIDFPIEALITNVDLDDDNNLVITFEDGSVTTIPLNTLLVGVVKSVNGKTPNSQGQVVITAEDIADLPTNYITTDTNQTGLSGDKTSSGIWTLGEVRKAGQNDTQILLAGGGHRPVSDFALAGSLSDYLPLSGGTMINGSAINWLSIGRLTINNINRLRFQGAHTYISGDGGQIFLRPNGDGDNTSQVNIDNNGQINTANHGNSSQWKQAYDWVINGGISRTSQSLSSINDLDLVVTPGYYHYSSGSAPLNTPTSGAGYLEVVDAGSSAFIRQSWRARGSRLEYQRTRDSDGVWSDWVVYYNSDNFNPAQYVLQSALNMQLANYVPINGVTTINNTKTFTSSPIVPNGTLNSHAVNLGQLNDKLDDKASTNGSNTTGGVWKIDELTSNQVGDYVSIPMLSDSTIGIPSTDALGTTAGVTLMTEGAPLAIYENTNPDWDGYIYRAGEPLAGYPDHAKTGNYLIESKHRFRVHKHDTLDDLSGGVGTVILNPYSAIEHQYFDVNISEAITGLELVIQAPVRDELTGHLIRRNFYGQRISVNVRTNAKVMFTNIQGVSFPNDGKPGIYKFVWDGLWLFDGYSPNEF